MSKNTPWLNEKVFSDLSSDFKGATYFAENHVPSLENTPWLNEKVFSDHNSENEKKYALIKRKNFRDFLFDVPPRAFGPRRDLKKGFHFILL